MRLWEPSQKGLLLEAPHRHRAKGLLGGVITLPSWSLSTTSPLTSVDPFLRMISSTSAIILYPCSSSANLQQRARKIEARLATRILRAFGAGTKSLPCAGRVCTRQERHQSCTAVGGHGDSHEAAVRVR